MARDTSFSYSFLVLPPHKRRAIAALWDFCRAADDAVDAPAADGGAAVGLARWRRELAACYGEGTPTTAEGRSLQPHILRFALPRRVFEDLLDGIGMDLDGRRYATFGDLYQYCLRVASAVGLLCVEVFGYEHPGTRDYAIDLGIALQLTNIVRDIPADLACGRLYVPLEDLASFGCTEDDLRAGRRSPEVTALVKHQCDRARQFYARARASLPRQDARRVVAAEIMGAIYLALLERVERVGYDVFSHTVRVPRHVRAGIAAVTWMRTMAGRPSWNLERATL